MVLAEPADAVAGACSRTVTASGRAFRVIDDPVVSAAASEFTGGFEEGTLQLFDAVLPEADRMVDFGAYIGFTALYAATHGPEVFAFEASPTNFALLRENIARNPELAPRIRLHHHAVGDREGAVTLYAKGFADSGSSIFQDIERGAVVRGAAEARVPMRHAGTVLEEIGLSAGSLLKIDIEGAEYGLIPAIAGQLARCRPVLHLSFHPFNIVRGGDPYATAAARIAQSMRLAEALARYRLMYCWTGGRWLQVARADRMDFLRNYLLRPKPVERVASLQYGFTDPMAFSERPLPLLG